MCRGLKPIFENLKNKIRGVKFEYMDVAQDNLKLHKMSLESNNPITSVPSFFLFHNGIKIAEYIRDKKLNENLEKMNNFLIINIRENKNNFKVNQTNYGGAIPYNMASRPLYLIVE
ncbi:thioredoxin 2 [Shrimp hemocyte iridescent virus]|uniref:Thioredoxin 2 n=2 Tax=Decapodiridovirus litopenaeus1 TaxID=3428192 RepID=A0A291B0L3_9VIRU|nr:thioredoxin 2 [Shrimp hemocyte iridescent virus]ATE87035.1 thioredoxin 2 [Shrimp hemocyte iridescent virus]